MTVVVILIDQHLLQLSSSSDMPSNAVQVLDVLIQYLVVEHIDYAVELGLQGICMVHKKFRVLYFTTVTRRQIEIQLLDQSSHFFIGCMFQPFLCLTLGPPLRCTSLMWSDRLIPCFICLRNSSWTLWSLLSCEYNCTYW